MRDEGLRGVRIALFEARMGRELAELLKRRGGIPTCVPALKEVGAARASSQIASFVGEYEGLDDCGVVIALTGAGVAALFEGAEALGRTSALVAILGRAAIVCRGPKPTAVFKRYGLLPRVHVPDPYTTTELLRAIGPLDLEGRRVAVVHYGERSAPLADVLTARGAVLKELCLYEWQLPDNLEPLKTVIRRILAGEFEAVVFTSQIQCRHVLQVAARMGMDSELVDVLNTRTAVAAMGPTCRDIALSFGLRPSIVPEPPKMGAMVAALSAHFSSR